MSAHHLQVPGYEHLSMFVHESGDQVVSPQIRREGIWEPYETELVLQLLEPGDTFVDVGANIGYYSLLASERVGPNGHVIAYEPVPGNFALLEQNCRHNKQNNVRCHPAALSNQNSTGTIHLSDDNHGDHRIYASDDNRHTQPIQLVDGGQHLSQQTEQINLFKVDTQGAEYQVVQGLMPVIEHNRQNMAMILEFWPWGLRQSGHSGLQLLWLLERLKLQYFLIDHLQHRLHSISRGGLRWWLRETEKDPNNEGFINLLVTAKEVPFTKVEYQPINLGLS